MFELKPIFMEHDGITDLNARSVCMDEDSDGNLSDTMMDNPQRREATAKPRLRRQGPEGRQSAAAVSGEAKYSIDTVNKQQWLPGGVLMVAFVAVFRLFLGRLDSRLTCMVRMGDGGKVQLLHWCSKDIAGTTRGYDTISDQIPTHRIM